MLPFTVIELQTRRATHARTIPTESGKCAIPAVHDRRMCSCRVSPTGDLGGRGHVVLERLNSGKLLIDLGCRRGVAKKQSMWKETRITKHLIRKTQRSNKCLHLVKFSTCFKAPKPIHPTPPQTS